MRDLPLAVGMAVGVDAEPVKEAGDMIDRGFLVADESAGLDLAMGAAKPPFRPEAPQPGKPASKTAASSPRSASLRAAFSPVNPAPMIAVSTVRSRPSGVCHAAASGRVEAQ